jgi:hypothetical protein
VTTTLKPQAHQVQIPAHLPKRLAICFYVWHWIFEDAYADLDKAMRETKARGFNCVRVETGALLTHDQHGKPRGPIRFRPWIEGWNNVPYLSTRSASGTRRFRRTSPSATATGASC